MMRLATTFSFPIKSGTSVSIVCPDIGYSTQTGDSNVYCEGGNVFHFQNQPACVEGRRHYLRHIPLSVRHVTLFICQVTIRIVHVTMQDCET